MYQPDLMVSQKKNGSYLLFEDLALMYILLVVTTAELTISSDKMPGETIIDITGPEGIHPGLPVNGYSAMISATSLGFQDVIPDGIYNFVYTFEYEIDGTSYADSINRRFALFSNMERRVYQKIEKIYEHYDCDKPWASTYIKDALLARSLLKALESSAYLDFEDDYKNIEETLNKILT